MIPPPNVTGSLHMGHGFQNTLMDIMTRLKRMQQYDVLWQVGTDHAGIATQLVVERKLEGEGKTRESLGRSKFEKEIWKWKKYSGNTITKQLRRLGSSVDWSTEKFTMDADFSDAVSEVFCKLYDEGLIYKGYRLVNWDPSLQTALSDLEVSNEEESSFIWNIKYEHDAGHLTVATTRPETLLGDMAVAVNPKDKRYKKLIGKTVKLPLTDREIPVIADDYVDMSFGTGCLKVTPAHDFNDFEIGKRHKLEFLNILNKDGTLNENTPKRYQNLKMLEARKIIIEDLNQANLLVGSEKHKLAIPRGERTGEILEPYLTEQWYLKTKDLAKEASKLVKNGKVQFVPKNWEKTYDKNGQLVLDDNNVKKFEEKPQTQKGWINGGFFVMEPEFFDLIDNEDTILEKEPLEKASVLGELMAYKHEGFWRCMDTKRDRDSLQKLWEQGALP